MGENSAIQWTHHTFNPWIGCQRVSPGCQHCYAEALDKRWGGALVDGVKTLRWGPTAPRVIDDVSACGTGGLAASLDGEARHQRCFWCARIAAKGQSLPGTGEAKERQRRRDAEARRYARQRGAG